MTTNRYRRVHTHKRADDRYLALSGAQPNAQTLFDYLLDCGHDRSLPGLVVASAGQIAGELTSRTAHWTEDDVRRSFNEIAAQPADASVGQRPMALADWRARLVWLPAALRHNDPENPNQIRGWSQHWVEVPECLLKAEVWAAALEHFKARDRAALDQYRLDLEAFKAAQSGTPIAGRRGRKPKGAPRQPREPVSFLDVFLAAFPKPKTIAAEQAAAKASTQTRLWTDSACEFQRSNSELPREFQRSNYNANSELDGSNSGIPRELKPSPEPSLDGSGNQDQDQDQDQDKEQDLSSFRRERSDARAPEPEPVAPKHPDTEPFPLGTYVDLGGEGARIAPAAYDEGVGGLLPPTRILGYAARRDLATAIERAPDKRHHRNWYFELGARVRLALGRSDFLLHKEGGPPTFAWWFEGGERDPLKGERRIEKLFSGAFDYGPGPRPSPKTAVQAQMDSVLADTPFAPADDEPHTHYEELPEGVERDADSGPKVVARFRSKARSYRTAIGGGCA